MRVGVTAAMEAKESGTYTYTVIVEAEAGGGYHAFCPVLKGCHTQGDSLEEALANIREAIEVYIESMVEQGERVPAEDILIKSLTVRA